MHVQRVRPTVLQVTLHAVEMATLIAAARWAAEGGTGELDNGARDQIRAVLASYQQATRELDAPGGPAARHPSPPDG